jgi:gamma-glutamyltranspeptidase / glutathione hydrolase / leukotriene-C4 hydrolase
LNDVGHSSGFAPHGKLLKADEIFYNKKLAETLSAIAKFGPQALYGGIIGINLVKDVQKARGILTLEDLKKYTVK